jgi:hypothetical protein
MPFFEIVIAMKKNVIYNSTTTKQL